MISNRSGLVFCVLFLLAAALAAPQAMAQGAAADIAIEAQPLENALIELSSQTGVGIFARGELVEGLDAPPLEGNMTMEDALRRLLDGTGLTYQRNDDGSYVVMLPSSAGASVGQRRSGIEEIIVTGQKREERIQDVPIAISAFTQEDLTTSQIAGGPDLHLQVPNMTFTKTNFTGYSIQIRGIGTQAISATTDPAVAVALNNSPFIQNRFFEQEFYDLERVEVLRGPQGTLFGRNATAGVVNLITAKPKFQQESMLSFDKGNYDSRRWEFMINQPLVDDRMAFRLAGAGTKRDGYAINELTDRPIDGRDLWSTRASLRFAPNDRLDMNLLWEHFEEEDDRLRSGKQLCKKHLVESVGNIPVTSQRQRVIDGGLQGTWVTVAPFHSTGCERESLYSRESFQTPNGPSMPFYIPVGAIGGVPAFFDPYASATQSRNLRVIESAVDPRYRAKSDIGELQIDWNINDSLLFESETAYNVDEVWSTQDFNRFTTVPNAFCTRVKGPLTVNEVCPDDTPLSPLVTKGVLGEDGVFCDPQLGCSDTVTLVDLSTGESTQFNQEFRLSSNFAGPFNFNAGVNFTRFDFLAKYYVFINHLTLTTIGGGLSTLSSWDPDNPTPVNSDCNGQPSLPTDPARRGFGFRCVYTEANSLENIQDQGHNYFLSKNPYRLISYAAFGEAYYNLTDNLKLTAGLRWSVDEKTAPVIPSWTLAGNSRGYPVVEVIEQEWREPTGRLVLDWKPVLDFTDETLIYGSYSRGYKAGGANPPPFVSINLGLSEATLLRPKTFDAEFVNAFELGTKNTLADGAVTLNLAAFYYDYKDYQISEIVDRSAFNRNYDAEVWGGEVEADWWARENLRLGLKLGYQKTRIGDGEEAIDLADRTAGNELWTVVRPHPTMPSSCILPVALITHNGLFPQAPGENPVDLGQNNSSQIFNMGEAGSNTAGTGCEFAYRDNLDPVRQEPYEPPPPGGYGSEGQLFLWNVDYPGWNPEWAPNNGEGFAKDLGGNELPNAPNWTATLTGDYIVPLAGDWMMTAHTDIYWQSESWWRIFNDHEYNRLDDYFTMNLAAIFRNEASGWNIMAYIKNVTDEDAITGAFLNSDDTGLTTNVFLVEPRLYGLRVTKRWGDGEGPSQWLGGAAALLGKEPGEPSPFSLTLGGNLLRPREADNEIIAPAFTTAFDPNIDPTGEQGEKLDWGDGREIVLTYAPENGWRFSLGARFGESSRGFANEVLQAELKACNFSQFECDTYGPNGPYPGPYSSPGLYYTYLPTYSISDLTEVEEHLLVDFMVGRDVGLGLGFDDVVASRLSAGVRYANFQSRTDGRMQGIPDWAYEDCLNAFGGPCGKYSKPVQHTEYSAMVDVDREFEGVGPVAAWDASVRLLGDARGGHLDLDWSLSGGVLFGKQTTRIRSSYEAEHFDGRVNNDDEENFVFSESFSFRDDRRESVTVPTLGAGVGLSYRIGGGSISAGYHWGRYFDAIDGGFEERKEYDRTVDGPYLKVTFGGE